MYMISTEYASSTYTATDGTVIDWPGNEHCLVMVGYDLDADIVYLADPLVGEIVKYSYSTFYKRWTEQGCQGIVISK